MINIDRQLIPSFCSYEKRIYKYNVFLLKKNISLDPFFIRPKTKSIISNVQLMTISGVSRIYFSKGRRIVLFKSIRNSKDVTKEILRRSKIR